MTALLTVLILLSKRRLLHLKRAQHHTRLPPLTKDFQHGIRYVTRDPDRLAAAAIECW